MTAPPSTPLPSPPFYIIFALLCCLTFFNKNFTVGTSPTVFLFKKYMVRLLLKLDITKAFDLVSWPFLIEVMQQMGFGQTWRDIICGLLASSTTQVLLNGCPGEEIKRLNIEEALDRETPSPRCYSSLLWMFLPSFSPKQGKHDYSKNCQEERSSIGFLYMQMMWLYFCTLLM
jgi:hypothetical protein